MGTKSDKREQKQVNSDTAKALASENDWIFEETSAKYDIRITNLFEQIAKKIFSFHDPTGGNSKNSAGTVVIGDTSRAEKKRCNLL